MSTCASTLHFTVHEFLYILYWWALVSVYFFQCNCCEISIFNLENPTKQFFLLLLKFNFQTCLSRNDTAYFILQLYEEMKVQNDSLKAQLEAANKENKELKETIASRLNNSSTTSNGESVSEKRVCVFCYPKQVHKLASVQFYYLDVEEALAGGYLEVSS